MVEKKITINVIRKSECSEPGSTVRDRLKRLILFDKNSHPILQMTNAAIRRFRKSFLWLTRIKQPLSKVAPELGYNHVACAATRPCASADLCLSARFTPLSELIQIHHAGPTRPVPKIGRCKPNFYKFELRRKTSEAHVRKRRAVEATRG